MEFTPISIILICVASSLLGILIGVGINRNIENQIRRKRQLRAKEDEYYRNESQKIKTAQ